MALAPIEDGYAGIATALYGDGAWEIVKSKKILTPKQQQEKNQRTQARVALASNAVGLTAGTAGLIAATKLPGLRKAGAAKLVAEGGKTLKEAHPLTHRILPKIRKPENQRRLLQAGAAGAVGLQAANLVGDAVANRVLSRSAKKKPVSKGLKKIDGKIVASRQRAARIATAAGAAATAGALTQVDLERKKVKKNIDFVIKGEISKSNDKRQVFGWASVVELNGEPIVDLQGDYMAIDVIEKAAYDYVHSSRRGGDMHAVGSHASDLIESFIVTPEKKQQLGLPDEMPVGWWVGFQVNDEKVWEMVKDGKRPEFSIHGSGQRVDVEI